MKIEKSTVAGIGDTRSVPRVEPVVRVDMETPRFPKPPQPPAQEPAQKTDDGRPDTFVFGHRADPKLAESTTYGPNGKLVESRNPIASGKLPTK